MIISVCEIGLAFIFGGNRNRRWIGRSDGITSAELETPLCMIACKQDVSHYNWAGHLTFAGLDPALPRWANVVPPLWSEETKH